MDITPPFSISTKFIASKNVVTPYFMIGPVLGKINFHRELNRSVEENGIKLTEHRHTKFNGGISVGLRGAIGVNVRLNPKLSFFSEIIFTGMNYYPKRSEITRYVINGENKISSLSGNVRKTIFVKKVSNDTNETDDSPHTPNKSVRFPIAMSSLATTAGVRIDLQ